MVPSRGVRASLRLPSVPPGLVLLVLVLSTSDGRVDIAGVPVQVVRGLIGGQATLPCPTMEQRGDTLELALWYRHDSSSPFYTFDARGRPSERGRYLTDAPSEGGRVQLSSSPWGLRVSALRERDSGLYVCRAEFSASSTRTSVTRLEVIVPPGEPVIFDDRRWAVVNRTAPVPEGQPLFLTCEVSGGHPPPELTWTLDGRRLEGGRRSVSGSGAVQAELALPAVRRRQQGAELRCTAANTNLTGAPWTAVRLELLLAPLTVQLTGLPAAASAGSTHQPSCRAAGARPAAHISWTLDGAPVTSGTVQKVSSDGNVTTSSLTLTVPRTSEPLRLSCSAWNPQLPHSEPISDSRQLAVHWRNDEGRGGPCPVPAHSHVAQFASAQPPAWSHRRTADLGGTTGWWCSAVQLAARAISHSAAPRDDAPVVSLQLGRSLDPNVIKEGNDVYFECDVEANPSPGHISWFHQDRRLQPGQRDGGVIVHERSLVLPNVSMDQSGEYSCEATNAEGSARSASVRLRVLYAPRCQRPSRRIYFLPGRQVEITCQVTAQPLKLRFKWFINRSTAARETIEPSRYTSSGGSSVLRFTLGSPEYAVIGCTSSNAVGLQRRPCLFQMLPASLPERLRQCEVHNQTVTSFEIGCQKGSDGGLQQVFALVVWQDQDRQLVRNVSSSTPYFRVTELSAGTNFTAELYAVNGKGRGRITRLQVPTLELTADRVAYSVAPAAAPVAALLSGSILATLLLLLLLAGALVTVRRRAASGRRHAAAPVTTPPDKPTESHQHITVGPDIVPADREVTGRPLTASLVGSCLPDTDVASPYYRKRLQTAIDSVELPRSRLVAGAAEPPEPPPPPTPPPPPVLVGDRITFTRCSHRQSFV
ncbi:synaptogenesis protein syg-2-like [Amphibalanus amphitrite]|uniref:synaptogenesis protein syg-2-like n=1 Tax=Amphibalanus amphitrite TaxID=1232801 RepID=UPI001C900413|nr:synaptogenesis protein syg-2-like [Amphibalanus amphitrite]